MTKCIKIKSKSKSKEMETLVRKTLVKEIEMGVL